MKTSTYLKNLRSSKKKECSEYQNRLDQLHTIQRNLRSVSEEGEGEINQKVSKAQEYLLSGIQPDGMTFQLREQLDQRRDKGFWDSNIDSAYSQLSVEERRVIQKIEELQREISGLETKISNALTEEKNAQAAQK